MAAPALSIKAGATLQLLIAVTNDDTTPFDLSTATVSAFVRDAYGHQVDTLILTTTGTPGQLSVSQSTATWPIGALACDLKFVDHATGTITKSDTFAITVIAAITS